MKPTPYSLKVANPEQLPVSLEGSITRLEGTFNFKPHVGLLANGEVVMFLAHAHSEEKITSANAVNSDRALSSCGHVSILG